MLANIVVMMVMRVEKFMMALSLGSILVCVFWYLWIRGLWERQQRWQSGDRASCVVVVVVCTLDPWSMNKRFVDSCVVGMTSNKPRDAGSTCRENCVGRKRSGSCRRINFVIKNETS